VGADALRARAKRYGREAVVRWAVLLLLPLLSSLLGLVPETQTSEDEAREAARYVPEVADLLSKPTVETSATYLSDSDEWKVVLTEEASGSAVAQLTVEDDSGEVTGSRVSPNAYGIAYPNLSEEDATKLATADEEVREWLSNYGSYTTDAEYEDGKWTVHYRVTQSGEEEEIARVEVDDDTWVLNYVYTGDQVAWQMARGESGAYGKQANYWYVWGPMALAFALAFLRTDKLFSLRNLDIVALLGFLISHGFFRQGFPYEAVLLWYPPLLYLLVRTLLMGFGIGERVEKTSNFPTNVLFVLAVLSAGLVLALNTDARVIDVGYAGVVGADRILDGTLPYGNMPDDVGTGDTYGPLNYILYVPFVILFGFSGEWDFLPAAHSLTAFSFVAGAVALVFAGYRLAGLRGAAALVFAWTIFPYTLYTTNNNTNDVIVASVAAISLATAASPIARGAMVAAGFSIKLYPLILGPLWMLYDGRRRSPIIGFVLGGAAVIVATFWVLLLDGHPIQAARLFYEKTLAFQTDRETPWTIYEQVPWLDFLQRPLTAAVIFLAILVAFFPRRKTMRRLAALSAALVIAFQLTTNYWFYPYVTWFEPFVFLALLPATNEKTALDSSQPSAVSGRREAEEPAPHGASYGRNA
jgi:hypothetical protein